MSPLDLIPGGSTARLVLAAAAFGTAFGAGWAINGWRLGAQIKQSALGQQIAITKALEKQAQEYAATINKLSGIANGAEQKAKQERIDAVAAGATATDAHDSAGRLQRFAIDAATSLGACHTASAAASAAGATARLVLTDVLSRLDSNAAETESRGRQAAEALGLSHGKGLTCERSYDAVTAAHPPG